MVSVAGNVRTDDPQGCGAATDGDIITRGVISVSKEKFDEIDANIRGRYWYSHTPHTDDIGQFGPLLPSTAPEEEEVVPTGPSGQADEKKAAVAENFLFGAETVTETVTEKAMAPAVAAIAVVNAALAVQTVTSVDFGRYLAFFFTQPVLLLKRRRRKAWGTVYNSLSRLPEDLVIVRLRDAGTGRLVGSEVTDRWGRFGFIVPQGRYRLEAVKANTVFPSRLLEGKKEDGQYLDLYHGGEIAVGTEGAAIIPNLPVDPDVKETPDALILKKDHWRRIQSLVALLGPAAGLAAFVIIPSPFTGLLLVAEVLVYLFFRRFAVVPSPKKWGTVLEKGTPSAVKGAVLRIFALPYNKLLEYRVSDGHGRYNFRVGNGKYYLTVTKTGYEKTKTDEFDFMTAKKPQIITEDIGLNKG